MLLLPHVPRSRSPARLVVIASPAVVAFLAVVAPLVGARAPLDPEPLQQLVCLLRSGQAVGEVGTWSKKKRDLGSQLPCDGESLHMAWLVCTSRWTIVGEEEDGKMWDCGDQPDWGE